MGAYYIFGVSTRTLAFKVKSMGNTPGKRESDVGKLGGKYIWCLLEVAIASIVGESN